MNSPNSKIERTASAGDPGSVTTSKERTAVEGLEDLFKWASDMVATGEDPRARNAREARIRRQVLEVMQQLREHKAVERARDEVAYLQKRVIALLQKLQEFTEENTALKQIMVAQYYELQQVPRLQEEIKRLQSSEFDRKAAEQERENLLDALAKLKVDRDFLDELLQASEEENTRLARLLADAHAEVDKLRSRRWWHRFWPQK